MKSFFSERFGQKLIAWSEFWRLSIADKSDCFHTLEIFHVRTELVYYIIQSNNEIVSSRNFVLIYFRHFIQHNACSHQDSWPRAHSSGFPGFFAIHRGMSGGNNIFCGYEDETHGKEKRYTFIIDRCSFRVRTCQPVLYLGKFEHADRYRAFYI